MWKGHLIYREISQLYLVESKSLIAGNYYFSCNALKQHFSHVSLETEYSAVLVINYTILRGCSSFNSQKHNGESCCEVALIFNGNF